MFSIEEINQLAEMCKLKLSQEEVEIFITMFSNVLTQVEKLNDVNTQGVEPTLFVNSKHRVLREDTVEESLPKEEVLKNAPEQEYGYFKLLRVMD